MQAGFLPTVSVIVPAYNAARTIRMAIEALMGQDYPKDLFDVTVVDDGSKDDTGDIVKRYPVRYVRQENKGPATARNHGAMLAKGGIILFTDADCVPKADWVREMVKPFVDPKIAAVKGAYRTGQTGMMARFSQLEFEERFEMLRKAEFIDMVDTYSAGFRREIFESFGGFDTSFPEANNEDTELSYRMSNAGHNMVFNPDAIVSHLNHPDSIKRYARIKFWRGYWRIVVYKRFPGKAVKDTYTPQTLKLQILSFLLIAGSIPFAAATPAYGIYMLVLSAGIFILLSIPFVLMVLRKDPLLAWLTPAFLLLRAGSIGSGALWGALKGRG